MTAEIRSAKENKKRFPFWVAKLLYNLHDDNEDNNDDDDYAINIILLNVNLSFRNRYIQKHNIVLHTYT